jgi:hypothetical protein
MLAIAKTTSIWLTIQTLPSVSLMGENPSITHLAERDVVNSSKDIKLLKAVQREILGESERPCMFFPCWQSPAMKTPFRASLSVA